MNKSLIRLHFSRLTKLTGALFIALAFSASLWAQVNSKGEEFFMVSSVDQQTHQVVLMRPTQLTLAVSVGPQTVLLGDKGQKMTARDLRAGDTVWAVIKTGKNGAVNALRIREGAMTETELRQLYLHYSTGVPSEPDVKPMPLSPAPQKGGAQPRPPSSIAPVVDANAGVRAAHQPGHIRKHPQGSPTGGNS